MNRVDLDRVPVGNNEPEALGFPLPSLRQFLMPDQTVKVKTFTGATTQRLDEHVNKWVYETKNIIATVSPVAQASHGDAGGYLLSVTYVEAARNYKDV